MIDIRLLPMRKSPFHDDNLANSKEDTRKTIRIPTEAYDRMNDYFEANNMNFSEGVRSLCYEKLDTICNERKTFNNLECFMLIPNVKIKDFDVNDMESAVKQIYHILNSESQIIAIVNTECDFRSDFNHVRSFNDDYNLIYEMKPFEAENFPMHILQNTKETCVYRTNKKALNSFHTFKDRLSILFPNLNVDDCYFVRFPLNNYLDEFRSGQFQQEAFRNNHEGAYIFTDYDGILKYYCFIDWSYSHESDNIDFELYFTSEDNFLDDVRKVKCEDGEHDVKLINSALHFINGEYKRKRLEVYRKRLEKELKLVNQLLEDNQ